MTHQRIFTAQAEDGGALDHVQPGPAISGSPVTSIDSTTPKSITIPTNIHMVIVVATEAMYIAFNATASSSVLYINADTWYYFPVTPGDTISFLAVSTTGNAAIHGVKEI